MLWEQRLIVSVSQDWTMKVWDLDTGDCVADFEAEGALTDCAVSRDGRTIIAGEDNGAIRFIGLDVT